MHQPAVDVDSEARRAPLKAAGVKHHVVVSAVCQGGVIKAGGAKPAVGLLVPDSHWRRRTLRNRWRTNVGGEMRSPARLTFAQLGLHTELQVLAVVLRVDDAVERSGRPALELE